MKEIAPSFLSADLFRAGEQLSALEAAGCRYLHLDIMDGNFVPNISFGPSWAQQIARRSSLRLGVHLMVQEPDYLLPAFAQAQPEFLTIHAEAVRHLDRSLRLIRDLGLRPGLALNPATPLCAAEEVLELVDLVVIMSVNPGFAGQKMISNALPRLERLAQIRSERGLSFLIEVDGGVNADNVAAAAAAGADILVAGNAVMAQPDVAAAYLHLHQLANNTSAQ